MDLTKYIDFEFFVEIYGLGCLELKRNGFLENNWMSVCMSVASFKLLNLLRPNLHHTHNLGQHKGIRRYFEKVW